MGGRAPPPPRDRVNAICMYRFLGFRAPVGNPFRGPTVRAFIVAVQSAAYLGIPAIRIGVAHSAYIIAHISYSAHGMPFTHDASSTGRMSPTHHMPVTHHMPFTQQVPLTHRMASTGHVTIKLILGLKGAH